MKRDRVKNIGAKTIEVPNIFASYRIGDYPRAGLRCHPWAITDTQALLLNAYDLLGNRRTRVIANSIIRNEGKLHEYVEFRGPLILDSGAFNFMQHKEIGITAVDVLKIGLDLAVDVSVVLDHPFPANATLEEIDARWENTRANTQAMVEALAQRSDNIPDFFQLMPVLHGHTPAALERSLTDITNILGREPNLVGIGSLAPLALNGSKRTVIDVIAAVRQLLPQAHIHCFSLGSALLMLFAFYCGADTVDSQTWIMSAAFKQVQLPGFHLTRLSAMESARDPLKYERTRRNFAEHLLCLAGEEGFAVRDWDTGDTWPMVSANDAFAYLDYLEDRGGVNYVHRRACHNLYAFNFEAKRVRQEVTRGRLEAFIQRRMKSTVYKRVFEYAMEKLADTGGSGVSHPDSP